jgi:FlaG/FlaF family flagellin (archaellin)
MRLDSIKAGKRRRAVSVIVAELMMLVVVLIVAVILAGFVYGTMAGYIPPAEVAAEATICSSSGGSSVCQFMLTNLGPRTVNTDGLCTMTVGGSRVAGVLQNGGAVPPNGSLNSVECLVSGGQVVSGSTVGGTISLSNGAQVYYAGTVS